MAWYETGTISVTAASKAVTGTGTLWTRAAIRSGDAISIKGLLYEIDTVDSDVKLTLKNPAAETYNGSYYILPMMGGSDRVAIAADVATAATEALRRDAVLLLGFQQVLFGTTPAMVDVTLPDGSVIKVPNWAMATQAANSQDWANQAKADMIVIQNDVKARQSDVANKQQDVTTKQADVTQKATNAANSASLASKWAENAEDVEVTAGHFSSLHWSAKSEDWAALAEKWAETQEDTEVTPGHYSSLHWAAKAAADRLATAEDRVQTGKDVVAADGFAADAKKSAGEAAQYDPTKSFVFHGLIPAADNINDYAPDTAHRGVWYATGGTVALGYPVEGFTGPLEVFTVDSSGVQRATHQDGQVYFRWYQTAAYGTWIPMALGGVNSTITGLTALAGSLRLGADGSNPADATTLRQMQQAIAAVSSSGGINGVMSTFIGDVSWWVGDAALLPTAYVMPSGQLSLRSDYPEVWALIDAGVFRSTTEASWNDANATARGVFTKGTVTSGANANFRWPDLNGGVSGSIGGLFLRGPNGPADAGGIGVTRVNAAPNISGSIDGNTDFGTATGNVSTNAFTTGNVANATMQGAAPGSSSHALNFNASRSNAAYGRNGATEVRPNSVSGYWIMRAKGTFSAQTNFNVYTSVSAAPANGTTTEGGTVRSVLMGPNGELGGATLKYRHLVDASGAVSKRAVIGVSGGAGEVRVSEDGTVGIDGGLGINNGLGVTGNASINGLLTFATAAQRRALATHIGFTGNVNRVVIPISATQGVMIQMAAAAPNTNSSGDATITFPVAFQNVSTVVVSNGNGGVGMFTYGTINTIRPGGFDFRAVQPSGATAANTQLQINYTAIGLVNL